MASDQRAQLDAARKNIPRFLFRCWTPNSGGELGINTTTAITPRGFLEESNDSSRGFYGHSTPVLKFMIQIQLCEDDFECKRPGFANVFSTWSASLREAMTDFVSKMITSEEKESAAHAEQLLRDIYLSVVDVDCLPKETVAFYPASLEFLDPKHRLSYPSKTSS